MTTKLNIGFSDPTVNIPEDHNQSKIPTHRSNCSKLAQEILWIVCYSLLYIPFKTAFILIVVTFSLVYRTGVRLLFSFKNGYWVPLVGGSDAYFCFTGTQERRIVPAFAALYGEGFTASDILAKLKQSENDLPCKMKAFPRRFLGYYFWVKDPFFDIQDRVKEYPGTIHECVNTLPDRISSLPTWTFYVCSDGFLSYMDHVLFDAISGWRFFLHTLADDGLKIPIGPAPRGSIPCWMLAASAFHAAAGRMRCCWTPSIPLQRLKAIRAQNGGATINDIFLSCTTGAVKQMLRIGKLVTGPKDQMSAVVCVSTHGRKDFVDHSDIRRLKNDLSYFRLCLPVNAATPKQRLMEIQEASNKMKGNIETFTLYTGLELFIPSLVPESMSKFFLKTGFFTIMTSSPPGPEVPIKVSRKRVNQAVLGAMTNFRGSGIALHWSRYGDGITLALCINEAILEKFGISEKDVLEFLVDELNALDGNAVMGN